MEARELFWDEKRKRLLYKGRSLRNLGWESWLVLQQWVSDDWGKVSKPTRRNRSQVSPFSN